jgi:stress-induced morphogen
MISIEKIEAKLRKELSPASLTIINESQQHAGHSGAVPGQITHLRIEISSEKFNGLLPIKQHRLVNSVLEEELANGLHALSLKTTKVKA